MDLSSSSTPPTTTNASSITNPGNLTINPPGVTSVADAVAATQQEQQQQGLSSPSRPPKKSSSTCTTCRARKVRCNGVRPLCSNCQRLGFPCSYDDESSDPAATAAAWSVALPRRRVKQACLSCHSRKARCSGHMPSCDRCRTQGIECIYRPTKRARTSGKSLSGGRDSPQSYEDERDRDDGHLESDTGYPEITGSMAPNAFHDFPCPDESFDALIGRTFEKFFRHVHHIPMFSFLHRASLMEQYSAAKVDKSLLLALIGITSCLTDMGPGMKAYGAHCIDEAESLIFQDYARPSAIKAQALILIIKHRTLSNRWPNAFVLLTIASRYAAAMRLNYENPSLCFLAQESRRRLMWAIYCIDASISGGNRDFSLWRAERLFIGLPCNERNFEFDLPQPTERLVPQPGDPPLAQGEDIGSLALHIRIQYIRQKISEFTKEALIGKNIRPSDLQTRVLSLHQELEEFAAHLPSSFQFSENSLRLRAYSPRICVFVMIHVWWRQCHCELYRLGLVGLREALPRSELEKFDESFIEHCQRQCVDHAMAMASIFSSMQKLGAKPVADLDLAMCAYQCARMLKYAYHANSGKLNLSPETIMDQFKICLQAVRDCCVGAAAAGIRSDLERLISQGLGPRTAPMRVATPTNLSRNRNQGTFTSKANNASGQMMFRDMDVDDSLMTNSTPTSANTMSSNPPDVFHAASPATMNNQLPPAMVATHPWNPSAADAQMSPQMALSDPPADGPGAKDLTQSDEFSGTDAPSELNNAYEGAMDGMGMDNGLDYAMGIDLNMWAPGSSGPEWSGGDFVNNGAGVGV